MNRFEKVSFEQFKKDVLDTFGLEESDDIISVIHNIWDDIELPTRSTKGSAGYDFKIPFATSLHPNDVIKIPTGIRCQMNPGTVLMIYPRSSLGFKYHMVIENTTPIVDEDYYNAKNEGHIFIKIRNMGDKDLEFDALDKFVQGILFKYEVTDDDSVSAERKGGIGSTGK